MIGVPNRVPHVVCEVGTCFVEAAFTEHITVIPGNPDLRHERPSNRYRSLPPARDRFSGERLGGYNHSRSRCPSRWRS